jgi:hypothetical protein
LLVFGWVGVTLFLIIVVVNGPQGGDHEERHGFQREGSSNHEGFAIQDRTATNCEDRRGSKEHQIFTTRNRKGTYFHSREEMIRLLLIVAIPLAAFFITLMLMGCTLTAVPRWYRTGNSSGFYNFNSNHHVVNQ